MRHGRLITTAAVIVAALASFPALATASTASFTDDATADFAAGTPGSGATVVAPGAVQVIQTTEGFDAGFPSSLLNATENAPGGTATVTSGVLHVDGDLVEGKQLLDPGEVAEFSATFSGATFQHVGFGTVLDLSAPFAVFTSADSGLLEARTFIPPTGGQRTPLNIPAGVQHTFRIVWSASEVNYYVDGNPTPVATHSQAIGTPMSLLVSDAAVGGGTVEVDSLRFFRDKSLFTSRVFDSGDLHAAWGQLTATGSNVTFETRSGSTPAPDSTWSSFQPVTGGAIASPSARYIQYRATLAGDTGNLDKVTMDYVDPAPTATIGDPHVSGTSATVSFSSPDIDVASFACSLDGAAYAPCTSPAQLTGLAVGTHTLSVRATDKAANTGTAASKTFTIAAPTQGGGSQGGGNSTNPRDTTAPKVTIAAKSLRASKRGTVGVKVGCPATETSCKITVQLMRGKTVAAKKTVTVKGGKTKTVTLQLTKAVRRQLASHHSLKITAVVAAKDAAGNKKTTKKSLTLRG
jgi:hypothetical protein